MSIISKSGLWPRIVFSAVFVLILVPATRAQEEVYREVSPEMSPTFTVLFDNVPYEMGYRTAWGYSCLIRGLEKTILFDTGADGRLLLDNMETAGFDPKDIDVIILSHFHLDHTGSVHAVLDRNPDVTLYLLKTFPDGFKDEMRTKAAEVIEVTDPVSISTGVQSTGKLGGQIPEQSLAIKVPGGLVVVTGCAHPGLPAICRRAREIWGPEPVFLMGGFHLRSLSKTEVNNLVDVLEPLDIRGMSPSHCTGGTARHAIEERFGERYLETGAGRVITMAEIGPTLR